MTTVECFVSNGELLHFDNAQDAKEHVANQYKDFHGENAIVLFKRTRSGLFLEIDDEIWLIRE